MVWSFWIAGGLAVLGGIVPLLAGGTSSRIGGVILPFAIAALALGACASLYRQGRPITAALYFIAGLAIVYGILSMIAVPLRLAVIGTCPPAPAQCVLGYERPMTGAETTGLQFAVSMGVVSVITGFFGLVTWFRHRPKDSSPPPARRIAPPPATAEPASEAALALPAPDRAPGPDSDPPAM